jgi:HAD superfamily hydrolase (TIGR01490 family)
MLAGEASAAAAEVEAALTVVPDPRAAAFFDVDNTVVRGASIFHLARGLYNRRFFTSRDIARFAVMQLKYVLLGSEDLRDMEQARTTALSFIEGHSADELRRLGEEIFDEHIAARIWPGTRALAQMHIDAGQRVWLVTATPVELAVTIAHRLGLTGALGTVAEVNDGRYTGRLVGEPLHGLAKAEAVRALAVRESLELARCAAYSDSANDIPLLSLVGHPCAVNPDNKLRAHARAHGWQIRDYRTHRKVARVLLPFAAMAAIGGAVLVVLSLRRRRTAAAGAATRKVKVFPASLLPVGNSA